MVFHHVKSVNINILQAKKYYLLIKVEYKFTNAITKCDYDDENRELLNKTIFNNIAVERQDEILKLSKNINYSNLTHNYLTEESSKSFNHYRYAISLLTKVRNGKITPRKAKKEQNQFKI